MPSLAYQDFIPRLIEERSANSTLCLTSGVPGPIFESFESLISRANNWLAQNPDCRVISCESLVIEGAYNLGEVTYGDSVTYQDGVFHSFLTMLRIWITSSMDSLPRCTMLPKRPQIGYTTIMPARLETSPKAFGPKYEGLSDAIHIFNEKLLKGEESIPGSLLSMETCTCRFVTRNCSVDPGRTFWMSPQNTDVHCYHFIRLYYVEGDPQRCELAYTDFTPQYKGNPKKCAKAEHFVHLARRAEQWVQAQNAKRTKLLNVQTLDNNMLFKCVRDALGHPRRALDSPYCVHSHCNILYHTKVLRLYYLRQFGTDTNNNPHLLHKTFHIPLPITTAAVSMNQGRERSLFPCMDMEEVMAKIRRWIALTGVKVTGVETLSMKSCKARDALTAESTHSESHGARAACVVYAVRLYVTDESGHLSKKDLTAEPRSVKAVDHQCVIL